jgi:hypothetical protein
MEVSTYDSCLLIIFPNFKGFGIVGMQTNDNLGLSDDKFTAKESEEMIFTAKKKQFLTPDNALFSTGLSLLCRETKYVCIRKIKARSLRWPPMAHLTSSNEPEEPMLPQSANQRLASISPL